MPPPPPDSSVSARACILVAFGAGAAVLAVELAAGRLLIPVFGQSVQLWSVVITVTLWGLAAGYALGARLATRASARRLAALLMIAGAGAGVVMIVGPAAAGGLSRAPGLLRLACAAGVALLPSLVALGAVSPVLVGLIADPGESGAAAGRIFAWSTLGGLAGGPATGLFLLPSIGVRMVFGATGVLLLLLAIVARPRSLRGVLSLLMLVSIVISIISRYVINASHDRERLRVLRRYRAPSGDVVVLALPASTAPAAPGRRVLLVDGWPQNVVAPETGAIPEGAYQIAIYDLLRMEPGQRAFVVGLGAGVLPMAWANAGVVVEVAEPTRAVIRAAREYFHFDPGRVGVYPIDGRRAIAGLPHPVDAIVIDAFVGSTVPPHLFTREALLQAREHLGPDGVWVAWVLDMPEREESQVWPRVARTAAEVFPQVRVLQSSGGYRGPGALGGYLVVAHGRGEDTAARLGSATGFTPLPPAVVSRLADGRLVQTDDRWDLDRFGGELNAAGHTAIRLAFSPEFDRLVLD